MRARPGRSRRPLVVGVAAISLCIASCSDADDGGGDDPSPTTASEDRDAAAGGDGGEDGGSSGGGDASDVVPLSGLDLPFELSFDPPVPADAEVVEAIEREPSAATLGGFDIDLETSASYEQMAPIYDEYIATFAVGRAFPESQSWSASDGEGDGSGLTIAFLGDRLNIAEIFAAE